MSKDKIYTLLDVSRSIERALEPGSRKMIWIKAELSRLNFYRAKGHCYPSLIQKEENGNNVIAQFKGIIWNNTYKGISQKFIQVTGEEIKDNSNILFLGQVNYHSEYGLSLTIHDIDPSFTLGDIERLRKETINRLEKEQLLGQQKELVYPTLLKRIAIISVETSKGYADFNQILSEHPEYKIIHHLYPALLQGNKSALSIINQMERIENKINKYDALVIMRGGGGEVGLTAYNDYELNKKIAKFPIPVLCGIGHATDQTIADLTCYKSFSTPTDFVKYLINQYYELDVALKRYREKTNQIVFETIQRNREAIQGYKPLIITLFTNNITKHRLALNSCKLIIRNSFSELAVFRQKLTQFKQESQKAIQLYINRKKERLTYLKFNFKSPVSKTIIDYQKLLIAFTLRYKKESKCQIEKNRINLFHLQEKSNLLEPKNILKKGFAIVRQNNKTIKNINQIDETQELNINLYEGIIRSKVIKKK